MGQPRNHQPGGARHSERVFRSGRKVNRFNRVRGDPSTLLRASSPTTEGPVRQAQGKAVPQLRAVRLSLRGTSEVRDETVERNSVLCLWDVTPVSERSSPEFRVESRNHISHLYLPSNCRESFTERPAFFIAACEAVQARAAESPRKQFAADEYIIAPGATNLQRQRQRPQAKDLRLPSASSRFGRKI